MSNLKENPFTIIFGIEPTSLIPRIRDYNEVVSVFESERPSTYAYVISGVRGCGKTVLMTSLQNYFAEKSDWIVIRLNPDLNLYEAAVSQLSEYIKLHKDLVEEFNINVGAVGIGVGRTTLSDEETLLRKMLSAAKKDNKRVLIAIDEASNTESLKAFAHSYQSFIGEKLPVFMLLTALPENFSKLANSKNGTFLKRLPKIKLGKLDNIRVTIKYSEIFDISEEDAAKLAAYVKGYPFAYQLLGDLLWRSDKTTIDNEILNELDGLLSDCVYTPIWNHLTSKGKKVICGIANSPSSVVKDIRELLGMSSNEFAPVREALIEEGLIDGSTFGEISFLLPRFREFVKRIQYFEGE